MKIEDLDLSVRAYNCLISAGIDTVEKLREISVDELARIRNMSTRAIEEIREKLERVRLTNADRIRAMSDEELAEWHETCPYINEECTMMGCEKCVLDWLRQPAEEATK